MLSSSWPASPTNGSPWRSSFSPGASPTIIQCACSLPTPNTVCVRPSHSRQARQAATRSRSGGQSSAATFRCRVQSVHRRPSMAPRGGRVSRRRRLRRRGPYCGGHRSAAVITHSGRRPHRDADRPQHRALALSPRHGGRAGRSHDEASRSHSRAPGCRRGSSRGAGRRRESHSGGTALRASVAGAHLEQQPQLLNALRAGLRPAHPARESRKRGAARRFLSAARPSATSASSSRRPNPRRWHSGRTVRFSRWISSTPAIAML